MYRLVVVMLLIVCLIFITLAIGLIRLENKKTRFKSFQNSLLYKYPESYKKDSSLNIVTVRIADETVYALHVESPDKWEQRVGTIHPQIFREVCEQVFKNHAKNVSLSKSRELFWISWTEPLYVPNIELDAEGPAMMNVLLKYEQWKRELCEEEKLVVEE